MVTIGRGTAYKDFFFDSPAVTEAVDKATRKAMSRAGPHIRATARQSMRRRKVYSKPGQPPSVHVGLLKRLLYFSYEPRGKSVVIGPEKSGQYDVPHLLEFGGTVVLRKDRLVPPAFAGHRGKRLRMARVKAGTAMHYEPRPFMGPALERERPKLPKRWANSVGG